MICELCKTNNSGQARFCLDCIAKLSAMLKPKPSQPKATAPLRLRSVNTHYRVSYKGFVCYVSIRDCPNMDEAPAYALKRSNREPWYPLKKTDTVEEIPHVQVIDHNGFVDWLREDHKEAPDNT